VAKELHLKDEEIAHLVVLVRYDGTCLGDATFAFAVCNDEYATCSLGKMDPVFLKQLSLPRTNQHLLLVAKPVALASAIALASAVLPTFSTPDSGYFKGCSQHLFQSLVFARNT
jgi:hypothetical protein